MESIYYRKIAELILRDEKKDNNIIESAMRASYDRNIKRRDRRLLEQWMHTWIDRKLNKGEQA